MTGVFESRSVEETQALARRFAKSLKPGDIVRLEGDLGAGKTAFVQGMAAELGTGGHVSSPTFCIVREHPGAVRLVHMDLYRLQSGADLEAIGWDDYVASGAIIAVEWPERAEDVIPRDAKRVSFETDRTSDTRRITFS